MDVGWMEVRGWRWDEGGVEVGGWWLLEYDGGGEFGMEVG